MNEQGNFDELMKEAANAAWDQDWEKASQYYMGAVKLDPMNTQALAGLGSCMIHAGKLQDAMQAWLRVSKLIPNDPIAHETLADLYLRSGFQREAAQRHLAAGEIYFNRGDIEKSTPHWEQAAFYDPSLLQTHIRLSSVYENDPAMTEYAIYAYLFMASLLQKSGRTQHAEQALLRAQELSPINTDIRDALSSLKEGIDIPLPKNQTYPPTPAVRQGDDLGEPVGDAGGEVRRNPIDATIAGAMEELAELVFVEDLPERVQVLILEGIESQGLGDRASAIKAYEDARKGRFEHPALDLLLGFLYADTGDRNKALRLLNQSKDNPNYLMAVNIAAGRLCLEDNQIIDAASNLLQALRAADEEVNPGNVDHGGYERILSTLKEQPAEHLADIARSLAYYLSVPDWSRSLRDSLEGYRSREKTAYATDLVEMILEGGRPEIAELMQMIDFYINKEMINMAKEETQHAIEIIPDYLPAHTKLADLLIAEGRMQEAAAKINLVATAYQMRGNEDKAADLLARVIEIWPADMAARNKVIEMLRFQKRINEATRQYIDMADIYNRRLADTEKAQKVYIEGLEYARQNEADSRYILQILKALADIEMQHLNWQKAITYYERVMELAPDDSEAATQSIDLYFQLRESSKAITLLDGYLRHLVRTGDFAGVITILKKQVKKHPTEPALRKRLSDVFLQQKKKAEAIEQLNVLGEMYLEAGKMKEARETIRKLISLEPPDVEGYKQLLKQIEVS